MQEKFLKTDGSNTLVISKNNTLKKGIIGLITPLLGIEDLEHSSTGDE
jgi:hypothetical protein